MDENKKLGKGTQSVWAGEEEYLPTGEERLIGHRRKDRIRLKT